MSDNDPVTNHILDLNTAWQAGRFEDLGAFYHPDVVLLPPDAGEPIVGRAAVVAAYREFAEAATLHEFKVVALDSFSFEGVSVCHMRFEIEYETNGGRFRELGLEVYVVKNAATGSPRPVIVWRSQAVLDAVEVLAPDPAD